MPQQTQTLPDSFKRFFLMEFTKELIRNSAREKIPESKELIEIKIPQKIETRIEPKRQIIIPPAIPAKVISIPLIQEVQEKPLQIPKTEVLKAPAVPSMEKKEVPAPINPHLKVIPPAVLRIPEQRLPEAFQYLRPYATTIEIDLGKLNPLIKDPNVRIIECNGPEEHIIVEGTMGRKFTDILMSKEEINETIKKFAEKSKIPISAGTYKVVVGRFIFMAVISDIISSKFVIKKLI